jgi:hypothetical protein
VTKSKHSIVGHRTTSQARPSANEFLGDRGHSLYAVDNPGAGEHRNDISSALLPPCKIPQLTSSVSKELEILGHAGLHPRPSLSHSSPSVYLPRLFLPQRPSRQHLYICSNINIIVVAMRTAQNILRYPAIELYSYINKVSVSSCLSQRRKGDTGSRIRHIVIVR